MRPLEQLKDIVDNGIVNDIYRMERAYHLSFAIGDNSNQFNDQQTGNFGELFCCDQLTNLRLSLTQIALTSNILKCTRSGWCRHMQTLTRHSPRVDNNLPQEHQILSLFLGSILMHI
jgi:hypothetical protein